MATGKEVATRQPKGSDVALTGQAADIYKVCVALARSSAVPMQYIGKPDWIFSTVMLGKDFGLGPMAALTNISTINGKPTMSIHLMVGLCQRHPEYAGHSVKKWTKTECEVTVFRKVKNNPQLLEYTASFSMDEARQAKLVKTGGAWETYPKQMLLARSLAFAFRLAFADSITGVYSPEEMDSELYAQSMMDGDLRDVTGTDLDDERGSVPERKAIGKPPVKKPASKSRPA